MGTLSRKHFWRRIRKGTRRVRHYTAYVAVLTLQFLVRLLPLRWGIRLGGCLGSVAYTLVFWERRNALQNLRDVFADTKTDREIRAIARKVFINLGYSFAELFYLPVLGRDYLRTHVTFQGYNYLNDYNNQGKGTLAVTGHFGNWEMMAAYMSQIEHTKFCVVARKLSNRYFDRMIMENRRRWGVNAVHRGRTASAFLRALRSGQTVAILADQDTRGEGVFVDFFGKPAHTQIGPALLALRLQAPMIPLFMVRTAHDPTRHTIYMDKPLSFELTGDRNTDIRIITELLTKTIESYINRFPEQWTWFHRRWKTLPDPPGGEGERTT